MTADERRDSILAVAARVFAEKGYEAACVAEVARQAGVSEPLLYKHFGSKRDLFVATARSAADGILEDFALAEKDGPSPVATVRSAYHARAERSGPAHFMIRAQSAASDPEIRAALREANDRVLGRATQSLQKAADAGYLRPGLDVEALAWLFSAVFRTRDFRTAILGEAEALAVDSRVLGQLLDLVLTDEGRADGPLDLAAGLDLQAQATQSRQEGET